MVALRVRAACGQDAIVECSGTMVSPRAMLTAAHCVEATPLGVLEVVLSEDATDPDAPSIRVAEVFVLEDADLAIVVLTEAWAGVPATLGDVPLDAVGREVVIAGYGDDGDGALGRRQEGTAIVDLVEDDAIVLVPGPALTCGGDSGGPVRIDGAVIAVTSFGDAACAQTTTAVRLDVHRGFLDDAIAMAAMIPTGVPGPGVADCGGAADGCCSSSGGGGLGVAVLLLALLAACGGSAPRECEGTLHGAGPPDGTMQWCTDADGKKHGVLREWKPGGQLVMQARFVHGTQDGPFARWFDDGSKLEEGAFAGGLRAGAWTEWHANGNRKRDTEYLPGGDVRWTIHHEDGYRWIEGGSRQQREHGHFVEWYAGGGKAAEGEFVDGEKTGAWSYWTPDGAPTDVEQGAYAPGAFSAD